MTTSTSTLTLKTAIGGYGHFEAIKNGSLAPDRVQFDHVEISPIINAFRRMCRQLEFDISEMAITTYLTARRYGLPFTAIPVYPVRAFHHGAAVGNVAAGVSSPKDLEGKKAGVRAYTVTTGVWARGILASEYGVDLDKIDWYLADEEHVEQFHKDAPSNAHYQLGADLAKMVLDKELAGGIGVGRTESEDIKPLVPNARQAAAEWNKRTGIYPINHMVVVKNELLDQNPWLAPALFEAFKESKQQWLAKATDEEKAQAGGGIVTGDPYPYGVEANRPALEAIIGYAYDQHILTERYKPEDIFAAGTQSLTD
jgi:4,5-dihydroxyphthalate decarboxylase